MSEETGPSSDGLQPEGTGVSARLPDGDVPDSQADNIWTDPDRAAQELRANYQPVDYADILGDARVLFLGENHTTSGDIGSHLASYAAELKNAGITHYAIEASPEGNEALGRLSTVRGRSISRRLRKGKRVDLSSTEIHPEDYESKRENYEEAIRKMAAEGINVVAVDTRSHGIEKREAEMTAELQGILEDPQAKIAYRVGALHATSQIREGWDKTIGWQGWTRTRLNNAGIPTRTVMFAGGDTYPGASDFDKIATTAGLQDEEFSLDVRPYHTDKSPYVRDEENHPLGPFEVHQADFIVHLPQRMGTAPSDVFKK